ncbi:hypothetical protein ACFYQQ_00955 [Streptomyces sp. NPDC005496]|uniref:hypothetical protein n=1 Tax=unclassified Streptomyces TaxID=2593676 RepID=UPI0033BE912B
MPELITRRGYLANAIQADGRPLTTQHAVRILKRSPWPTAGRNTVRKDLRNLAARGLLVAVIDDKGRRTYYLNSTEGTTS